MGSWKKKVLVCFLAMVMVFVTGCAGEKASVTMKEDGSGILNLSMMIDKVEYEANVKQGMEELVAPKGFKQSEVTYRGKKYMMFSKSEAFSSPEALKSLLLHYSVDEGSDVGSNTNIETFTKVYVTKDTFQATFGGVTTDNLSSKEKSLLDSLFLDMSISYEKPITYTNGTLSEDKKTASWTVKPSGVDKVLKASTIGKESIPADKTKPVVSGVKNYAYYKSSVHLNTRDNVGVSSITLNKKKISVAHGVVSDGRYTVVAKDYSGNTSVVRFCVDKKAPVIYGVSNGKTYRTAKKITLKDNHGLKYATLNGKRFRSGTTLHRSGSYSLRVTDKAGNVRSLKFRIRR